MPPIGAHTSWHLFPEPCLYGPEQPGQCVPAGKPPVVFFYTLVVCTAMWLGSGLITEYQLGRKARPPHYGRCHYYDGVYSHYLHYYY